MITGTYWNYIGKTMHTIAYLFFFPKVLRDFGVSHCLERKHPHKFCIVLVLSSLDDDDDDDDDDEMRIQHSHEINNGCGSIPSTPKLSNLKSLVDVCTGAGGCLDDRHMRLNAWAWLFMAKGRSGQSVFSFFTAILSQATPFRSGQIDPHVRDFESNHKRRLRNEIAIIGPEISGLFEDVQGCEGLYAVSS